MGWVTGAGKRGGEVMNAHLGVVECDELVAEGADFAVEG